ncbi:MAG: tol-pal system-associated acyl-CoA thioesterase [Burkholderiales bacterium]|jgi:acyl-CoA thioester hydrolase|nr:tol-pal system-associated acyl-CoA thioesterase [Burkholderiales bacterium]
MQERNVFEWPVRIYYEDTDAAGVVYYANYLRFMERARTEWLSRFGIELAELEKRERTVFVVTRVEIDYLLGARLGDRLSVTVEPVKTSGASFTVAQRVHRTVNQPASTELLVDAQVTLACLNADRWRPVRIPATLRTHFSSVSSAFDFTKG